MTPLRQQETYEIVSSVNIESDANVRVLQIVKDINQPIDSKVKKRREKTR